MSWAVGMANGDPLPAGLARQFAGRLAGPGRIWQPPAGRRPSKWPAGDDCKTLTVKTLNVRDLVGG